MGRNHDSTNKRIWHTFWGHEDRRGVRYRHQVRCHEKGGGWMVRTEVLEEWPPYFNATQFVPEEVGKRLWELKTMYDNTCHATNPMYPPEFAGGFGGKTCH